MSTWYPPANVPTEPAEYQPSAGTGGHLLQHPRLMELPEQETQTWLGRFRLDQRMWERRQAEGPVIAILAAVLLMTPAAMAFNQPLKSGGGVSICVEPSCAPPVPGPGGILGLAAGWKFSRQLRRRIRGVR